MNSSVVAGEPNTGVNNGSSYCDDDPVSLLRITPIAEGASALISSHRIRKIDLDGIITTVAGTGEADCTGDGGPATPATLRSPTGIGFDPQVKLLIFDSTAGGRAIDRWLCSVLFVDSARGHWRFQRHFSSIAVRLAMSWSSTTCCCLMRTARMATCG